MGCLEKMLSFPVIRVKGFDDPLSAREKELFVSKKSGNTYRKSYIPAFIKGAGMLWRKCTRDFKITPIIRESRKLGNIKRGQKTIGVVTWIGISLDEVHRMKPSQKAWIEHRWPLVEMKMSRRRYLRTAKDL